MDQGIYRLESVNQLDYARGMLRSATDSDTTLLISWLQGFMSGIYGNVSKATAESALHHLIQQPKDRSKLFIWEVDGVPVTMAGYTGATSNGFRVSYVYTPTEFRRNDYASACTAMVSQQVLDMGKKYCFLYTDLDNPTTNHIYQKIGYELVCTVKQYRLG